MDPLDFAPIRAAWAESARTALGVARIEAMQPLSLDEVEKCFDAVDEVRAFWEGGDDLGTAGIEDLEEAVLGASRGETLDGHTLLAVGRSLLLMVELERRSDRAGPVLGGIAQGISLDQTLGTELEEAFEPSGRISAARYPEVGSLRRAIESLHSELRSTLDTLVKGEQFEELLQDNFWTQRNNRYVLPIKSHAKGWDLGIVHGASGSGQTVFIEPHAVLQLNNRLRVAEAKLEAEERRILSALSRRVGVHSSALVSALQTTAVLDTMVARAGLANRLEATRPVVGHEGVVRILQGRHPVLVLRGIEVIANDLSLASDQPILVLSGPNAGGKTVALKTIGSCAQLVRYGCFVPCNEDSRVDYFDAVDALIGDQQTVEGDLSSFSAHLVALKRILAEAGPGTLVLLDELASGTDPSQGAAFARAVLEQLATQGARIALTTHYAPLKALATVDPRVAVAAVQYAEGRPTYHVIQGATGESHAFDIAARVGLPAELVERARGHMGEGEAKLGDLLAQLESEQVKAADARAELERIKAQQAERLASLEAREARIAAQAKRLEAAAAEGFVERLKKAQKAIGQVVAQLQANPSHQGVAAARASLSALEGILPSEKPKAPVERTWKPGDRVKLEGGQQGTVVSVAGKNVTVSMGAITLRVKANKLQPGRRPKGEKTPKATFTPVPRSAALSSGLRLASNTVSLRGMRVEEALELTEAYFDKALQQGVDVVFVLHGHGTGAMKDGVREWLPGCPYVSEWAPAAEDQGGDAFTVVRLG